MTSPTTIKPLYVTDTNALYWYLTQDKKLSKKAKVIFEAAQRGETRIVVSVIVMAELYFILQKKPLQKPFTDIYIELRSQPYFRFVPLNHGHILDFAKDAAVPEMHDRIITGLARRLNAPLLTSDPLIAASNLVTIEW